MTGPGTNLWGSPAHALEYLARADTIPHRSEGERTLLEFLPAHVTRVLDLGSGDGRLLALVKLTHPDAQAVAIDFSEHDARPPRRAVRSRLFGQRHRP